MKRRIVLFSLFLIAALVIIALALKDKHGKTRIAINIPLTGPVASITGNYPKGFKMGIEDACAKYGIDPSSIEILVDDNKATSVESASVYRRQTINRIDAFISGTTEAATVTLPQIDALPNVANFLIAFDSFLTRDGKQRFRLFPSFKTESEIWISYITLKKPTRVVALTLNIPATEEQFSKTVCPFILATGASVHRERFDFATTDFRTIALRIKDKNPDCILISGYSFQLRLAIKAIQELSIVPNINMMCSMDFCDFLAEDGSRNALSGISFAAPNFIVNQGDVKTQNWKDRFKEKFATNPAYPEAYAYDLGFLFVKSLHSYHDVKPSSLLSVEPFDGISGRVKFDEDRDSICSLSLVRIDHTGVVAPVK